MTRTLLIAGNWKMNGRTESLSEFAAIGSALDSGRASGLDLLLCVPATLLSDARRAAPSGLAIGAQDCHTKASGAHTGDISAEMIADTGAGAVIVGHSERRADHRESDDTVRGKAEAAHRAGLLAIVCVGESEDERKRGVTLAVLGTQIDGSLPAGATPANTVVAYEPIWAIGTGATATAGDVAEVHAHLRRKLADRFGGEAARSFRILYGGSVKPANAAELMSVADVDGALVGGASLKAEDFLGIVDGARAANSAPGVLE